MSSYKEQTVLLWEKAKNKDYRVREELADSLADGKASKENRKILFFLLNDKKPFVRSAALKALLQVGAEESFKKVVPLLNDKDEVVRVDAVECAAALGKNKASRYLEKLINDRSEIVRMYAGAYIGQVGNSSYIAQFEKRLQIERSPLAKVGLLEGLYLLGMEEKLLELLSLLIHPRYHVRCAVANSAPEVTNRRNKKLIREVFLQALKHEKTESVKSCIKKSLRNMK